MVSVDIRQFISPWPFTVDPNDKQEPSLLGSSCTEKQHYLTPHNLNEFTDDEISLWWYAFCGGEGEVGKVLYNRCSRTVNENSHKGMRGEETSSRQSHIQQNAELLISQVYLHSLLLITILLCIVYRQAPSLYMH